MNPVNNSIRPIPKNQNKIIRFGLFLLLIIGIPVFISLIHPIKQQVPKASKNIVTPSVNFTYNTVEAQQILDKYIRDNLKEDAIPTKIEIKQKLLQTGALNAMDNHLGANWKIKDNIFNASLNFIYNSNNLQDISLLAIISDANNSTVNEMFTTTLLKTYFKTAPETQDLTCGVFKKNTSFCESFKISEKGKIGFGVERLQQDKETNVLLAFSCFFPKNDSYYTKRTSCLIFREKDPTGL